MAYGSRPPSPRAQPSPGRERLAAVTAEERRLQLDFHALLADYVGGRRRGEDHPDGEQRCVVWVGVGVG